MKKYQVIFGTIFLLISIGCNTQKTEEIRIIGAIEQKLGIKFHKEFRDGEFEDFYTYRVNNENRHIFSYQIKNTINKILDLPPSVIREKQISLNPISRCDHYMWQNSENKIILEHTMKKNISASDSFDVYIRIWILKK